MALSIIRRLSETVFQWFYLYWQIDKSHQIRVQVFTKNCLVVFQDTLRDQRGGGKRNVVTEGRVQDTIDKVPTKRLGHSRDFLNAGIISKAVQGNTFWFPLPIKIDRIRYSLIFFCLMSKWPLRLSSIIHLICSSTKGSGTRNVWIWHIGYMLGFL